MTKQDIQKYVLIGLIVFFSFCIAYFIDNYYIEGKGIGFLFTLFHL